MNTVNKSNGELPAFACVSETYQQDGLTKREYFAVTAMQGILASRGLQEALNQDRIAWEDYAVEYADKLLSALEKK